MTEQYSFIDIFNRDIKSNGEVYRLKRIVIPKIQRDYAQGRIKNDDIKRVRDKFINALYEAVLGKPIVLDFIYGNIENDGILTPLDGQQRLTTLFLLHWYAAKKDNVDYEDYKFLKNFSYETRYSARDFCDLLIDFNPSFEKKISEDIINQSWFPLDWKKDQTIFSMLTMLDAIDEKFRDVNDMWNSLVNNAITFYFLPIKDMGLSDELYIKMNSRGKPLTRFENFKAEFEREIKEIDNVVYDRISQKIDKDWTDLLWCYRDEKNYIDDYFLRYFKYICDIICYKKGNSPANISHDEIDLISEFFSSKNEDSLDNLLLLEKYFDCWCEIKMMPGISNYFDKYISYTHEDNKTLIDKRYGIDAFKDCICTFGDSKRQFTFGRQIFLYAFITYLLNKNEIEEVDFRRRIRIVNNLINNSSDEISSNSETRTGGNRIPAALKQVDSIIINGIVPDEDGVGFNARQLKEEKIKLEWTQSNSDKANGLFELEDSKLLFGQISILGTENYELFNKFLKLFMCDWEKVDCALLTVGDYSQANSWNFQFGSSENESAWINLFHRSNNENIKKVLCDLLSSMDIISDDSLSDVIKKYIKDCEEKKLFDWKYYYIKYDAFRPGKFGKYSWKDGKENQYVMSVWVTDRYISQNAYQPFLKAIDDNLVLSKEAYGTMIIFNDKYIVCDNDGYSVYLAEDDSLIDKLVIEQSEDGIDKEDRILKMREYIKKI